MNTSRKWIAINPETNNKSMKAEPVISCLMVTLDRLIPLKRAVQCFCDQTYPNKELVIVTDGTDRYKRAIHDFLLHLGRSDIRLVALPANEKYNLGQLRNISVNEAGGEIICQWDDDDLYHPERLARQFSQMEADKAGASFFTDQLQFFWEERILSWVDWTKNSDTGPWQLIPGSIMMYKNKKYVYPEEGPNVSFGEDSVLLESLCDEIPISRVSKMGYLYVYIYHGRNTFSRDHHERISNFYGNSGFFLSNLDREFAEHLAYYPLPKPIVFE